MGREVGAEIRVRYGETDQMGVAYYANFLVWFEVGRNEYMRGVGYPYHRMEEQEIRMPVTDVACRYLAPARYDDVIDVMTSIEDMTEVRVRFRYRVLRRSDGRLLATGETRHAAIGLNGKPRRIPEEVKRCLLG